MTISNRSPHSPRPWARRPRAGLWVVLLAASALGLWSACGSGHEFNFFESFSKSSALSSNKAAKLEQIRLALDQKDYATAHDLVEPMVQDSSTDSNAARYYYAASILGLANLDIFSVINNILESLTKDGGSVSGVDQILNAMGDKLLGTGAVRTAKVQALYNAIDTLQNAPDPSSSKLVNTSCILAAFLAVPTVTDGTTAMTAMVTALTQVSASATSGGSSCPDIGKFNDATAAVTTAVASINRVLQVAKNCSFLNLDQTASQMNSIEKAMNTLTSNVDKGCDALPTCPSSLPTCQSLLPTCVQKSLQIGTSSAKAKDGKIAACEIVLNCLDPAQCFKAL